MRATLLFFLIFISAADSFCQNRNSVWCFGDSAGIDFSSGAPVTFASGMDGRGSCSSIADTNGNLLFYADTRAGNWWYSTRVYNSQHQIMQNGDSINGESWYNELVAVPMGNNIYYLFSTCLTFTNAKGLYYSIIDMNQNGGLGAVIQKNIMLNGHQNADCLSAIKHANGRDWWVISKLYNQNGTTHNRFYVYLITPSGVSDSLIQDLGNATDYGLQKLVFNSSGNRFMHLNDAGFLAEYNFDRCSGLISNQNIIFPEQTGTINRFFNEGAYSPDNSKFYLTIVLINPLQSDTTWLFQLDLNSTNISSSSDSLFFIKYPVSLGAVRLAPDGKVYVTSLYDSGVPNGYPYPDSVRNMYNENLGVVNYPDSLGAACDFQPFSFNLGDKRTYWGLPNNPNYELGALAGSPCDTLTGISPTPALPEEEGALYVYYHPVWQKAFINAKGLKGRNVKMSVVDLLGNVVYTDLTPALSTGEGGGGGYFTKDLNCAAFAKGMYIVSVVTEKERMVKKFIKE
jgi:hypothetical protein